jgi:putative toxin-antitoxin system antitoxin component (TIGR02293 family)
MTEARFRYGDGGGYASWDLATAAQRVAEGLPSASLYAVQGSLALSTSELSRLVLISPRTINRRKSEERLPPDESERVFRIGRLIEIAVSVVGSEEEARAWMKEENFALGGKTPLEMASTQPGAELVERVLHQIDHGITV